MKKLIAILVLISMLMTCACNITVEDESQDIGLFDEECEGPHVDDDDNGYCDFCCTYVIVTVDFYALNDLHGKFANTELDEGVDEMTTYLKKMMTTDDHFVLLSSGDMWQGASESNLTEGNIITDWMSAIGFDAMTIGNHEFDWGEEPVESNFEIAEFPLLAINIYDRETGERSEYCQPSVVIERGGLQIGIIGAIGDTYSSIAPEKVEGIYFKTGRELTNLVKEESERLRAEGVDYIVYSLHDGYGQSKGNGGLITDNQLASYYDPSLSRDGYVDLVFEAHTHKNYALVDSYGVYHLQGGGDNTGLSHVEVSINAANNNSSVNTAEYVRSTVYSRLEGDSVVQELLDKYDDLIAKGREVLGDNSQARNSTYMRQLIAKLYREKGIELWGDEYDIVLGGGFISIRSPYTLERGQVTYAMLQSLFPFDNNLVLCSIKGRDLRSRFINTDNSSYYCDFDPSLANNIDDDATYYIIVDSYSSSYAPNRLTEIARLDEDVFARDLLAEYIKQGGLE